MCGIVGYIGNKEAFPILIDGLKKLEYRGYDPAGIALLNGKIEIYKKKGKVTELEDSVRSMNTSGSIGIGHTRWATHGEPSDENAHPQQSMEKIFSIVHNGIIENYIHLKSGLILQGYQFYSDTEVLANLIEYFYVQNDKISAEIAVQLALSKVDGAYGVAILCSHEKDELIIARNGNPLAVGLGDGEYFVASDPSPIAEFTSHVVYLNDQDMAILHKSRVTLKNLKNHPVSLTVSYLNIETGGLDKGEFDHFILKEIIEQPQTIEQTFKGRLKPEHPNIVLSGLMAVFPRIVLAPRIVIRCGKGISINFPGGVF